MLNKTTDFKEEKGKSDAIIERMMNALSPDITTEENWKCEFYANTDNAMLSNKFTKEDIELGVELLQLRPKAKEKKKFLECVVLPPNPGFADIPYRTLASHGAFELLYTAEAEKYYRETNRPEPNEQRTKIYINDEDEETTLNFINKVIEGSKEVRSKATKKSLNKKVKLLAS